MSVVVDNVQFQKHIETLTTSQKYFVDILNDWFTNRRNLFVLVSGGPGSGKTHTVVKTLQWIKAEKVFMAPTARLANKINGQTIHSKMKLNWKKGSTLKNLEERLINILDVEECLKQSVVLLDDMADPSPSVEIVVVDEVGMIPFWLLFRIVEKFFSLNSVLFVCMGDSCQLKPVTSQYNVFQAPFNDYFETRHIEMLESKRFTPEYKLIIDQLRLLMNDLDDEKIFEFVREKFPVVEDLDEEIILKANRILAYTNMTVQGCNEIYLNKIMRKNQLYKLYEFYTNDKKINLENPTYLRKNCAVVVTENGCGSATNGTCLTFLNYDKYQDAAICKDEYGNLRNISRSNQTGKIPLTLGFAVTIHKFQGETIDENNIIFNFDGCKDLHLIYTALSRVRNMGQILAVVL